MQPRRPLPLHPLLDRRQFLGQAGSGLASIALTQLLAQDQLLGKDAPQPLRPAINQQRPLAPRPAHFPAKAKNVLVIFCSGACSQLDTWDYKPELIQRHGQPLPGSDKLVTFQGENGALTKSPYDFKPRGQCGKWTSDLLPRLGELVDDLCFLHSLTGKTNTTALVRIIFPPGLHSKAFPAWVPG